MASSNLTDEEKAKKEALLEEKMRKIREKNAAILKRNAEIEADKKKYMESVAEDKTITDDSPESWTESNRGNPNTPSKAPSGVRTDGVIRKMGGRGQRLAKMSQEKLKAKEWEEKQRRANMEHRQNETHVPQVNEQKHERVTSPRNSNTQNRRPQHTPQRQHQSEQTWAERQKAREYEEKRKQNIAAMDEEMKQEASRSRGYLVDDRRQDMSRVTGRNTRFYGGVNQRGGQQMSGRQKTEYQNWKKEREEVEQERLSRQKQGESWKREWDQKKVWDSRRRMWVYASELDNASPGMHQREDKMVTVSNRPVENFESNEAWDIEVTVPNNIEEPKPQRTQQERGKRDRKNSREKGRDERPRRTSENQHETMRDTNEHVKPSKEDDSKYSTKSENKPDKKDNVFKEEASTKERIPPAADLTKDTKTEDNEGKIEVPAVEREEDRAAAKVEKETENTDVREDAADEEGVADEGDDDAEEWEDDGEWETEEEVDGESESDVDGEVFHDCDGGGSVGNVAEQQAAKMDQPKEQPSPTTDSPVKEEQSEEGRGSESYADSLKSPTFDELFGPEPTTHTDWGDCEVDEEKLIQECKVIFQY